MNPNGDGAYNNHQISETLALFNKEWLREMERIFTLPTPAKEQAFVAFAMSRAEVQPRTKLTLIKSPKWHEMRRLDERGRFEGDKNKHLYIRVVKSA